MKVILGIGGCHDYKACLIRTFKAITIKVAINKFHACTNLVRDFLKYFGGHKLYFQAFCV